jgi:hypothetical protein
VNAFLNNLKRQAEENPILALGIGAAAATAAAKLISSVASARNSRAWAKEVSRRAAKDALKKK